jgi:hypothetical protein
MHPIEGHHKNQDVPFALCLPSGHIWVNVGQKERYIKI